MESQCAVIYVIIINKEKILFKKRIKGQAEHISTYIIDDIIGNIRSRIDFDANISSSTGAINSILCGNFYTNIEILPGNNLCYMIRGGKCYISIGLSKVKYRTHLSLLNDISEFMAKMGDIKSYKRCIYQHIKERMEYYSDEKVDKISQIEKDIDDTKNIMKDNLQILLERHEKIEMLEQQADNLQKKSDEMFKSSKDLHWKEYWKNKKCIIIGGSATALAAVLVVAGIIGSITSV